MNKKFYKNKYGAVLLTSAFIYLLINYLTSGLFDVLSVITYLALAALAGYFMTKTVKLDNIFLFLIGAAIVFTYHAVFASLGFFETPSYFFFGTAMIQQGLIVVLVATLAGDNK